MRHSGARRAGDPGAIARASAPAEETLTIPAIADDGSLFPIGKLEAHRRGQRHLAVSVFVFAGGKLLIQKRAAGKYHCGGLWANTCCTHPHWSESPNDCAHRRLFEEVGMTLALEPRAVVDYKADVGNGLIENERVHVFRGDVAEPFVVSGFNRDEVEEVAWVGQDALRRQVLDQPHRFTPWLKIYLDRWAEMTLDPAG
ncbi:MAG: NUDIX domain-containing protein [Rhizobiales bacterium]|jgi:isopentenyl-diphosphate delta-isomerase|nr:NUDIX domain-containing protein [Hyphomicrobiales bacterium]